MDSDKQEQERRQCNRLGRWAAALGAFCLPGACLLCAGPARAAVCAACDAWACPPMARCPCCANPLAPASGGLCGACLAQPRHFDATLAAGPYAEPLDRLVLQLKFGQRLVLAPWGAARLQAALAGAALPDLLCPVPLGAARLRQRGYNQALELARPLARALGLPLRADLLRRVRETAAQSSLAPAARAANVRGAFGLTAATMAELDGRHIGVVDDVMSSGHTLDSIAALLKRHGARRVSNIVLARTPPHREEKPPCFMSYS
ncbi:ComF family protein [Massilia sp. TS11]|uniref:ComF family protein n=1 Tax=Massilia sp. TS11 TaxID=2908003 RepID=UPI001EDBD6CB|nr:ComF family protein [Massilia sp. TS11]MCG2585366.1 ComF family protein [Massilia sp. TS11]